MIIKAVVLVGCLAVLPGCHLTPAQQAEETQIENVVIADLAAGKTPEQTEADVAKILAGQLGVDVVVVLNDVLQYLIDIGVISKDLLPRAKAMTASLHATIAARPATLTPTAH